MIDGLGASLPDEDPSTIPTTASNAVVTSVTDYLDDLLDSRPTSKDTSFRLSSEDIGKRIGIGYKEPYRGDVDNKTNFNLPDNDENCMENLLQSRFGVPEHPVSQKPTKIPKLRSKGSGTAAISPMLLDEIYKSPSRLLKVDYNDINTSPITAEPPSDGKNIAIDMMGYYGARKRSTGT